MIEITKDNLRIESTVKESALDKIPVGKTAIVQQNIRKKPLDDLGEIEEAKMHRSANRPLHKIKDFDKNIKFCQCCYLPCEKKGVIERFHYCDNIDAFSECGLGVSFYFYFFRFVILVLFISICAIIISMMVFNKHYTKGINRVCNNSYKKYGTNNITLCEGFVTESKEDLNFYVRFMKDWVLTFSSDNIKIYYLLHNSFTNDSKNAKKVMINYSILNFLLLFTIFYINLCYIILISARAKLIKMKKKENLTMRDYTVLISNAKYIFIEYIKQKKKENPGFVYQSQQVVKDKDDFIKHVETYIKGDKSLNDLTIWDINLCYNLGEYMEWRDELETYKKKIFKIKNNEHIIKINSDKGNLLGERYFYYLPFEDFEIYCIKWKDKPLNFLEEQKNKLEKKISEFENTNFSIITEDNFTGYMFVSFEYIKDKETILKHYPHDFFALVVDFFKNIKFYLCCCCIGRGEKIKFNKLKGIDVDDPPEPEDICWENYQYSKRDRIGYIALFFFICILIMGVSFGIVLSFTYLQNKITDNNKNTNLFVKYLLSILITIIIALLNFVLEVILEKLTKFERHLSKTNYYLSLSIKMAIFTFLNSAVVPLLAKELAVKKRIQEINYNIDRNNLIVDDMFIMFLVNAFVTPIFWTFRISHYINKFKIYLLEKRKNPDKHHYKTQIELNKLYEKPNMDISYKYAYLAKTTAMTFFYLPIFPLGFIISFLGFILGYFLELYNFTRRYKRPEMLNETISKVYADNFIIILFIGGVGDLFFFYEIFPNKSMSLVNFIIFLILIFIPYSKFLTCNFIGEKSKSEQLKALSQKFLELYSNYEIQNPFTKIEGFKHYINELQKNNLLTDNALENANENIDKLNVMEIYYQISRGRIPIQHQAAIANAKKDSDKGEELDLRKSLKIPKVRESQLEIRQKQAFLGSVFCSFLGNRQSMEIIGEEQNKFPMDTIDEESETQERLVNNFNHPFAINSGFGPMPIYKNIPLTTSKININDDNMENSKQELQKRNSQDIRIKINNDINNYKKRQKNKENKFDDMNNNNISNINTESALIQEQNNNNESMPKNDQDSESKITNPNMPFKASIHHSQNDNTNIKSSLNSLDNINKLKKRQVQEDINKFPLDTTEHNIIENNDNKSNNSNDVSNNLNNIFNMDSSKTNKNENNLIIDQNNSNNKKGLNLIPQNEVINNENLNNISNSDKNEIPKNNSNLSKSLDKYNIFNEHNNDLNNEELSED